MLIEKSLHFTHGVILRYCAETRRFIGQQGLSGPKLIYTFDGDDEKREKFINEHAIQSFSQRPNISPDLTMMMNNETIWRLEEEGERYPIPFDYQPENFMATLQMESSSVYRYISRSGLLRRIEFKLNKKTKKMDFKELGFDMMIDAQNVQIQE